jgi:hypothetical protein
MAVRLQSWGRGQTEKEKDMNARVLIASADSPDATLRASSMRSLALLSLAALALSGCYVVPVAGPDGHPNYYYYASPPPLHPVQPAYPAPLASVGAPGVATGGAAPAVLNARLYPANDTANQTGMLVGTVTSSMTGKGRFQIDYRGEMLSGEATRMPGDERRGIANAYGTRGTYMNCEYQMSSAVQGAGTCTVSNGAKYQVHVGG